MKKFNVTVEEIYKKNCIVYAETEDAAEEIITNKIDEGIIDISSDNDHEYRLNFSTDEVPMNILEEFYITRTAQMNAFLEDINNEKFTNDFEIISIGNDLLSMMSSSYIAALNLANSDNSNIDIQNDIFEIELKYQSIYLEVKKLIDGKTKKLLSSLEQSKSMATEFTMRKTKLLDKNATL